MLKTFIRRLRSFRAFWMVVRDPERTDQIFVVITDPLVLNKKGFDLLFSHMQQSPEVAALIDRRYAGRWQLEELLKLPTDTLGYVYAKHMSDNGLDIDFYPPVPGETAEAYIQARSRQTHDIWHVMTGFDTSIAGEIGLQAFVQAQMHARSPTIIMTMFLLHCCFFKPQLLFDATRALAHGWIMGEKAKPLFAERFEESWGKNLAQYRRELNLSSPAQGDATTKLPFLADHPVAFDKTV